ncbi:MAG: LPXTG cell wall anchor domain-containing protein [Pseudomonadota bacterium]
MPSDLEETDRRYRGSSASVTFALIGLGLGIGAGAAALWRRRNRRRAQVHGDATTHSTDAPDASHPDA